MQPWPDLEWLAPVRVLGAAEVAFLQAATSEAETWLASTRPVIATWPARSGPGAACDLGLAVQESPVSFLLAETAMRPRRPHGCVWLGCASGKWPSFGLPGWIRLRAAPPECGVSADRGAG
ncbi:MAG: hypothetical protein U1E70_15300 [Acetobacteraceae bacterium]